MQQKKKRWNYRTDPIEESPGYKRVVRAAQRQRALEAAPADSSNGARSVSAKPTFGILLVLLGLAGVWFLVTGKLAAFLAAGAAPAPPAAISPGANVVGGASAPLGGSAGSSTTGARVSLAPAQALATPQYAFGVTIGDGAAIEPLGAIGATA